MTFTFTTQQANILLESLDITLKQVGLKGLYTIVELVQLLQNPTEIVEDNRIYNMTPEQAQSFLEILDITTKAIGLQGAAKLVDVLHIFQNPQEATAETVAE